MIIMNNEYRNDDVVLVKADCVLCADIGWRSTQQDED